MEENKPKRLSVKQVKFELDGLRAKILSRNDLSKKSARATIVIAIITTMYFFTTVGILCQMRQDNQLQADYYQKTVRPFVYAHTFTFENVSQPINENSEVKIKYTLKNVGALPAKDIRHFVYYEPKSTEEFESLETDTFKWKEDDAQMSTSLYPNQEIFGFRSILRSPVTVKDLMKHKWAHILVTYKDAGEKKYFYKWIVELRITLDNGKLTLDPINKWSDFN